MDRAINKKGQVGYTISVLLVLIGFALFGLALMQNSNLTGKVISEPSIPSACSDIVIQNTWDSIFTESSEGISILTSATSFGGNCAEYFANKSNVGEGNITYLLYGYTKIIAGQNVTYVQAEVINATGKYFEDFLNKITNILNVSTFSLTKNNDFLTNYVTRRGQEISDIDSAKSNYSSLFKTVGDESWQEVSYLGNNTYDFSENLTTIYQSSSNYGEFVGNFSYSFFSFVSIPIVSGTCTDDFTCGSWSNCSNNLQNRTCINYTSCVNKTSTEVRVCGVSCVPNWSISAWSSCVGGLQVRNVIDVNLCGNNTNKPSINQTCNLEKDCTPSWTDCEDWTPTECPENGKQTRVCGDINDCGDPDTVISDTRSCTYKKSSSWLFILIIFVIIAAIILSILGVLFLINKKGNENSEPKNNSHKFSSGPPPTSPRNFTSFPQKLPIKRPILNVPRPSISTPIKNNLAKNLSPQPFLNRSPPVLKSPKISLPALPTRKPLLKPLMQRPISKSNFQNPRQISRQPQTVSPFDKLREKIESKTRKPL